MRSRRGRGRGSSGWSLCDTFRKDIWGLKKIENSITFLLNSLEVVDQARQYRYAFKDFEGLIASSVPRHTISPSNLVY